VQPLDQILPIRGFGFSANYTKDQPELRRERARSALGVPKTTYNSDRLLRAARLHGRVSYTFQEGSQVSTPNQNGITNASLFSDDYDQVDFSSYVDLGEVLQKSSNYWPQITFDVTNVTKSKAAGVLPVPERDLHGLRAGPHVHAGGALQVLRDLGRFSERGRPGLFGRPCRVCRMTN
jgi:hypothetical protein